MPAVKQATDFGFDPRESAYHFAVVTERDAEGVRIEERFSIQGASSAPEEGLPRPPLVKAVLDRYRWSRVSEPARSEFNRRLALEGARPARWRAAETLLAPHLGKELILLCWAVEGADATLIPNMVANWTGLAPEERWWLYTTINATAGHPEYGRDRGWRRAIKIALAENPAAGTTPGGWLSRGEIDQPEPPVRRARTASRQRQVSTDQLVLLPIDDAEQLPLTAVETRTTRGDAP